ncbi:MAG: hypothetical protein CM15mP21_6080 [Hyphomicrobiales bacterium]|nr:MAG: hypothetical protein CM15mP21_6080 [Hyphomicrobiales bacterium]
MRCSICRRRRHTLTSLWTPNSRYFEITEDGFVADDVIPGTITVDNLDEQCVRV